MLNIFKQEKFLIALSLIVFATVMRLSIPPIFGHLPNFSPILAIAMFAGIMVPNRWASLLLAFSCIGISDLVVNSLIYSQASVFYSGFYWQYACYFIMCMAGFELKGNLRLLTVAYAGFAGSMLFYLVSNFGVWASGLMYPKTWQGLMACYIAGIPFFKNSLASNLIFSSMLYVAWCEVYRDKKVLQA